VSQEEKNPDLCQHGRCVRPWIMQTERRDGTVTRMCAPHGDLLRSKIR
jgi:hypothetical protein